MPALALIWVLSLSPGVSAADAEAPDFDLFETDGQLTVLVDLAPLLTARNVAQLKEGIDFAVEYTVALKTSRRLWGSRKIASGSGWARISYRLATEDFLILTSKGEKKSERTLSSISEVHRFLADSVQIQLAELEELDRQARYFVAIDVIAITLTSFNLTSTEPDDQGESSPLKYLFKQFLKLTDYGREEYSLESRKFSLSEIPPR